MKSGTMPDADRKLWMLGMLNQRPRTLRDLTHRRHLEAFQLTETVIDSYLTALVQSGLVDQRGSRYGITRAGREELSRLDRPQEIENVIMARETYAGMKWNVRAGGEDHKAFQSRGIG
jgi:DNA-binding PadR family transcriptional regulator